MKAEVDFRFTVAVPLAVAGVVVSFGLQLGTFATGVCTSAQ
jgi:hypothetical protein